MKGLFIVFDGMDGTGKSTQLSRLHEYLFKKDKRIRILTTREPTYGKYGMKIREMLVHHKDPYSDSKLLLNLYVGDRKEHLEKIIKPFLKKDGKNIPIVLCDRYYYSTIAYQSSQGIDIDKVINDNKDFLKPDLAIILDLPPEIAFKRISSEREIEKFEKIDFMDKLHVNFNRMNELVKDNIVVIDTSGSQEETFEKIKIEVDKLFVLKQF